MLFGRSGGAQLPLPMIYPVDLHRDGLRGESRDKRAIDDERSLSHRRCPCFTLRALDLPSLPLPLLVSLHFSSSTPSAAVPVAASLPSFPFAAAVLAFTRLGLHFATSPA